MQHTFRADLHMHSTWSDGTDSPKEILNKVKAAGISFFAITDHDEYRGSRELLLQLKKTQDEARPVFITGAEFSCRDGDDKFHILGYAYDPHSPAVRELRKVFREIRMQKTVNRMTFLKDRYGFSFSEREMAALMRHHNPGKPHIAKLMIRHGYATTISEAILNYLDNYHGPERRIRPEEAIEAILAAGGIPVLAHGPFGDGEQDLGPEEMEGRILRLKAAGLMGVEAFYSGYSAAHRDMMLDLAARHGLLATSGSDYHGKNKSVILGDTGPGSPEEKAAAVSEFCAEALMRSTAVSIPYSTAFRGEE
ncbi:MAG: PHP domain-containing protein [Lachnospiraceae bacterium]|nr:PHP domain-containing protein [Lachnospiraceae bacterium]